MVKLASHIDPVLASETVRFVFTVAARSRAAASQASFSFCLSGDFPSNAPGAMLVYDTAGCEGGEGFNEMLLHLGCCMPQYDTA